VGGLTEPPVFDLYTPVLNHVATVVLGPASGLVVADSQLRPDYFDVVARQRLVDDPAHLVARAEHVDDVYLPFHVAQ